MKRYSEIAGDGGSDILGQVIEQRRAQAASLAGVGHLVAIASGKGGVGKSTLTLVLGLALRQRGRRVAILDCDLNGPCQAQLAGLQEVPWHLSEEGLGVPRRADGLGVLSLGGVLAAEQPMPLDSVAQGDAHTWRATREMAMLSQLITATSWGELDLLLVDLPPGSERTLHHLGVLGARTSVVLVTLPSALATGVVSRSLGALRAAGHEPLGYLENMAGYYCRDCGEVRSLFPEAPRSLDLPCLGSIPFDPEWAERGDRGWPPLGEERDPALEAVGHAAEALLASLAHRESPEEEDPR